MTVNAVDELRDVGMAAERATDQLVAGEGAKPRRDQLVDFEDSTTEGGRLAAIWPVIEITCD